MSKGNIHRNPSNAKRSSSKPVGYDYWSDRPGSVHMPIGRAGKKQTLSRERMADKTTLRHAVNHYSLEMSV